MSWPEGGMDLKTQLFVFMTALFSALLMVPMLRRWALDRGEVDVPDERKVHSGAIPRIGGIAVCLAFLFSVLIFVDITREIRGILAGTLVIFITGLVDDLHGISTKRKFFGEIAACLVTITVGRLYIQNLGDLFGFGEVFLPLWIAIPFTLIAVVGVINAMNLIDGLDGLAGGVSVIALCAFLILAWMDGNPSTALLCAALLGALLGFLKFNFYPARIFMGDTGSLTIGFVLAFLAILLTQRQGAGISPAIPVLILGVPILDTLWVMCRRISKKQSPFAPDRTHVHHKFLDLGFQHRFTVLIIYGISLLWAGVSIFFYSAPAFWLIAAFLVVSATCYGFLRYVINHREKFRILAMDSSVGIRESSLYRRALEYVELTNPLIVALTVLLLIPIGLFGARAEAGFWHISAVIFIAGLGLLYHARDPKNEFLLAMLFLGALVVAFIAQLNGTQIVIGDLTLRHLNNFTFIPLTFLIALRLFFYRPGATFLNTVDYLVIGMAIFFAIFLPQIDQRGAVSAALPKGIILFLAIKMIANQGHRAASYAVGSLLAILLVISLRSFVGQF
jgi:UDP-GlcNAc:undecaprenyl-phosphate/decaprenyl-phosphate GlcNAc-1-phosphate transferase